jgi:hypothetical protein
MFTGMGIGSGIRSRVAGSSSAARGLIPKSTGGRVAMGAGAAIGGGAVLAASRNKRSSGSQGFGQDMASAIASGEFGPAPTY